MVDPRLEKLLTTLSRGAGEGEGRWAAVEASLGLRMPASYKLMVDLFGASSWHGFLHVLSPFDEGSSLRLRGAEILEADRVSRASFPTHYPLPLYPEPGGLLPWAVTDNGDTLYFVTKGPPDEWPTVIKGPRAPEFEVMFLSPALLVHHFAAGTLRSVVLPAGAGLGGDGLERGTG